MGMFFSVGVGEVILLAGACLEIGGCAAAKICHVRWLPAIAAIFALAAVITPADPASTLLVAVPASLALGAGVRYAAFFRRPKHTAAG